MKHFRDMILFVMITLVVARADAALPVGGWEKILDTPASLTGTASNDEEVYALLEHRGLLYIGYYTAGLPNSKRAARLYTFDGKTQELKYTFGTGLSFASLQALGEYKGNLYAAMSGLNKGDGDIYVSTNGGTIWTKSYNTVLDHFCSSLVTFKDKLYAGMGYLNSRIAAFDGSTWQVVYPGKPGSGLVEWMVVYRGKLYAGLGGSASGKAAIVSTSDGINWSTDYDDAFAFGLYAETAALVEFRGKLYAGMLRGGVAGGDLLVRDDVTGIWSVAWSNPNGNRLHAIVVYNDRLYVGNANMSGAGDVYVSDDGVNFKKDLDTNLREVFRLYTYNDSLYMGSGFTNAQAQIWRKTDQFALRLVLRKLFEGHGAYTRNYIISALSDLADIDAVKVGLLKNQDDILNTLKPYYGDQVMNQLAVLFADQASFAFEVVQAVKTDNTAALEQAQNNWNINADAIGFFLGGINDHWAREDIRDALNKHLEYITGELNARVNNDWVADINFYEQDRKHMLILADMLTDGIVNHFPDKFRK